MSELGRYLIRIREIRETTYCLARETPEEAIFDAEALHAEKRVPDAKQQIYLETATADEWEEHHG